MSAQENINPILINGQPIIDIISRNSDLIVAISQSGGLVFEYSVKSTHTDKVIHKFHNLDSKLSRKLPDFLFKTLQRELGASLASALVSENEESALNCFSEVESRIKSAKEPEEAKAILLVTSIVISSALAGLLTALYYSNPIDDAIIFLCMAAGLCGSLFSLLNRNRNIDLKLLGGYCFTLIQSITISITGCISGLIVFIVSKSGIAFSFAHSNTFTLLTLCIIAGFSERLIPDLFGTINTDADVNKKIT